MRAVFLASLLLTTGNSAFGQGAVDFRNRIAGVLFAPVYGVNPAAPEVRLSGNATTNGGAVDYAGVPLLLGTSFTASLWAAPIENGFVAPEFQMLATASFRTISAVAGTWGVSTPLLVTIPFVTVNNTPVDLQVRVWDNRNGSVLNWPSVLADPALPRGYSEIFTYDAHVAPNPPGPMYGLTSFNLFVVPEPSLLALAGLGAVSWFAARRRRQRGTPVPPK
jgi:hypothetical protein